MSRDRTLQGKEATPGVAYLETGIELDGKNNIVVDMVANVTDGLRAQLAEVGATTLSETAPLRSIRAAIPPP